MNLISANNRASEYGLEYNIIIQNGNEYPIDSQLFFQNEKVNFLPSTVDLADIFVSLNLFQSKGSLKKDPKWGKDLKIPDGFSEFKFKKKNIIIWILNPIAESIEPFPVDLYEQANDLVKDVEVDLNGPLTGTD